MNEPHTVIQPGDMLDSMIHLTTNLFRGKKDKAGKPYILHCLKVMHYTKSDDEEVLCIAIGHDILKDCFDDVRVGIKLLRDKGFTERIVAGIYALTKRPGLSYEDYKAQVKRNSDARKVKMADLRHNSDIRRLKGVTKKDVERVVRYHEFYLELKELEK
jgi:(p)ppGpp synthase/HD superfamily hydrolase